MIRPQLRPVLDLGTERHASWLELFFDLIFVIMVSRTTELLGHDRTLNGFLAFAAICVPLWFAWVGYTFYADRFEMERDYIYRATMLAGMLAVAGLSVTVPLVTTGGSLAFALCYIAVRTILIILYTRALIYVHMARDLCRWYIIGFCIGVLFWIASVFVDPPLRFLFWGIGTIIEIGTPLTGTRIVARTPYDASHIPERFGLFTIIVLGESVLSVVNGLAATGWNVSAALVAVAGFTVAVSLWWLYFEFMETTQARRWGRPGQTYVYGHFPVALSIMMVAVGVHYAIIQHDDTTLAPGIRWALAGGVALYFVAVSMIRLAARRRALVPTRLTAACLFIVVAALPLGALTVVGLIAGMLVAEVIIETRFDAREESQYTSCVPTTVTAEEAEVVRARGGRHDREIFAPCSHIDQIHEGLAPEELVCQECARLGDTWVELRMCLICGHVGCCDTSKGWHAHKHFLEKGHPLMISVEPGQSWRWCYVDETYL